VHPWENVSGIFTLIFLISSFYFLIIASARDFGKRGWLLIAASALLGPAFVLDLVGEVYENHNAELLSHGAVLLASIFFTLSFYLSKKELEKKDVSPR
jgi:hypothetical protein